MTRLASKDELYEHLARSIADEIQTNNRHGRPTKLILPVGPKGQYSILSRLTNDEKISWKNVFVFMMDEYLTWDGRPIAKEHPFSFVGFMETFHLSIDEQLRIPAENVHFPDVYNIDALSLRIADLGGVDTCYGGLGVHGHVAFNEPPISRFGQVSLEEFMASKTRIVPLAPETIVMNSIRSNGGNFAQFPSMAVTIGLKDILGSHRIRLYCDGGEWQRQAIREALFGEPRIDYPVTLLQSHEDFELVVDEDTLGRDVW